MRNIFLLYMPPTNFEAMRHYEDTIRRRVVPERIYKHVDDNLRRRLMEIFSGRPMAVWGSRNTKANKAKFERMRPGDEILIVEGDHIKLLGKVAATTVNGDLSRELWQNLRGNNDAGWDLIYFIANPVEIDLPFTAFCGLFGYESNYQLRGFTTVGSDRLEAFYDQYDDLYSVLMRQKKGQVVYKREEPKEAIGAKEPRVQLDLDDIAAMLSNGDLSEHVRMQWTLINLGVKCGSKVWVPVSDQKKIREQYEFTRFETKFAAGLDTQTDYVENIDVVWKKEFRIDAAFEIENTTAIYSGLLRFADLSLVAPNTLYPLFIVAPQEKRNRLIQQLRRPTFRHMHMDRKVRYLSYETVDEIDEFARDMTHGLNVDLITGKSEEIRLDD